jgi:hypothetical protein
LAKLLDLLVKIEVRLLAWSQRGWHLVKSSPSIKFGLMLYPGLFLVVDNLLKRKVGNSFFVFCDLLLVFKI